MSRLSPASRDGIPEDQVGLFDQLVKKYGLSSHATASILVRVPRIWRIDRDLGDYLLHESSLSQDVVELVFLVVGRELDCQFMWDLHAGSAIKAGFPSAVVEALRDDTELPKLSDKHMAVIHYGREIYRNHFVSYGTFSMAKELFGERGVVELGLLFGRLHMHALLLNGTDADLRPNRTEPVLPIY
jgi:alkylhydroperoxidase family enzyme